LIYALYGAAPKVGFSSTNLPAKVVQKFIKGELDNIKQEKKLENIVNIPLKKKIFV